MKAIFFITALAILLAGCTTTKFSGCGGGYNAAGIEKAYNAGFTDGETSMRDKITACIVLEARNRVSRGDWNAVLFYLKN